MIILRIIYLTVILFSTLSIVCSTSSNYQDKSDIISKFIYMEPENNCTYLDILTSTFLKYYEPKNYDKEDDDFYTPSWMNIIYFYSEESLSKGDYKDIFDRISSGVPIDYPFPVHGVLSDILRNLLEALQNTTSPDSSSHPYYIFDETTSCQKWLNNIQRFDQVFLAYIMKLPACPCKYPSLIYYDDRVWDRNQRKYFRWRDVSGYTYRLDIYKPGASYCVQSLMMFGAQNTAVQHCCYDIAGMLLTRGSGAGTPYLISPEISSVLHEKIDLLPWQNCQNDFSRYHRARPPNNDNHCKENPNDNVYQHQLRKMRRNKHTILS